MFVLVIICMGSFSVQGLNKPTPYFLCEEHLRVFIKIIVTTEAVMCFFYNHGVFKNMVYCVVFRQNHFIMLSKRDVLL